MIEPELDHITLTVNTHIRIPLLKTTFLAKHAKTDIFTRRDKTLARDTTYLVLWNRSPWIVGSDRVNNVSHPPGIISTPYDTKSKRGASRRTYPHNAESAERSVPWDQ